MARIRYIGLMATDPQRLSRFYREVFDLKELTRTETGNIYLTDGYLNLGLIRNRTALRNGYARMGFHVDDLAVTTELLRAADVPAPRSALPSAVFSQLRAFDPEGNAINLAGRDYLALPEDKD
jgi:catechol 2,3-dioxygenase-like lactoylglutathione lyase family enzyme